MEECLPSARDLAAYYFWYFAAIGIAEPYLSPFWRQLGFSSTQLGLLNAIFPGVAALAPFVWTAYADATRRGEAIFRINTWVAALAALWLPNLEGLLPMAVAVLVYSVFRAPLIPLVNSMAFRVLASRPHGFAGIRLWGTIGYILTAVGGGVLVDWAGLRAGIHGIGLAMMTGGVVVWLGGGRERLDLPGAGVGDFLRMLRDHQFGLLLVATFLARVSFGPYTTFFTIHLEGLGLSRTFAGAAWALAAASELVIMVGWSRMGGWLSTRTWLTVALAAHALRWLLSIAARDPLALLAIQLTHALTFGVFYLAAVQSVDGLVPDGLRASAQGVFASVSFGMAGLLGNTLAGLLYEPLGMAWLYAAATFLAAVATLVHWAGTRALKMAGRAETPPQTGLSSASITGRPRR